MTDRHRSPLRYPGGKGRFLNYVQRVFEENDLLDGEYAEAYAGGAAVALGLLFTEYASRIHINDVDRSVYAFWHSVLNRTEALCDKVLKVPLTVAEWRRQRAVQEAKDDAPLFDLGVSTFYLNRVNRSGIIDSGGLIGGLKQNGRWGMDARFNREGLVRRIRRVGSYRSRIRVTQLDAIDFLAHAAGVMGSRALAYLDPPYFVKGTKLYANYYEPEDHADVAKALEHVPWPWLVSYDATPEILTLYHRRRRVLYGIDYTAADRYEGAEVMFFSPTLTIPAGMPLLKEAS